MASCHNISDPSVGSNGSMPAPMIPSVSPKVTLSLTVFYMVMYSVLFLSVYMQLWLILYYNYKRFSFQTVFLFLCALWSGLRATLFSFYFKDTQIANELPMELYWLLYCFPVCLQFFTLCLLHLYFAQVMFKARPKYAANPNRYIYPLRISCLIAMLIFLAMNITCAALVDYQTLPDTQNLKGSSITEVKYVVVARVLVNDLLFVSCAIFLAYSICKISKTTSANILLEAKGTTVCQATSVGILIVLLYASRAIYNLLAISPLRCSQLSSFNFDWYNVSDQADLVNLKDNMSYIVFGVVLFVWELLPTTLTIIFFRVRKPDNSMQTSLGRLTGNGYNTKVYFFDNPYRYDSDEELASSLPRTRVDPVFFSSPVLHNSFQYGSFMRNHSVRKTPSPRRNGNTLVRGYDSNSSINDSYHE